MPQFHLRFPILGLLILVVQQVESSDNSHPIKIRSFKNEVGQQKILNKQQEITTAEYFVRLARRIAKLGPTVDVSAIVSDDYTSGTGRQEKLPEQCASTRNGGAAALLGDNCMYSKWVTFRKVMLDALIVIGWRNDSTIEQKFVKLVGNLVEEFYKQQKAAENNVDNYFNKFFQTHCIACARSPYLQCDKKSNKCVCWEQYATVNAERDEEDTSDIRCRTKLGDRCDEFFGAKCVPNAYCNQTYQCECKENGKGCIGSGSLSWVKPAETIHCVNLMLILVIVTFLNSLQCYA